MIPNVLVDFFKRHNAYDVDAFRYIENHLDIVDSRDEEVQMFIGVAYAKNQNDKLLRYRVCIPTCDDLTSTLKAIHELTHGIVAYKYLGKKFKKDASVEIMSLLFEKIFIEETKDQRLTDYGKYLDSMIDEESDISYRCALSVRDELYEGYTNFDKTYKKGKKLAKKYERKNS